MARAYVISDVAFRDGEALAAYRELAARSIAAFGGRYLVRGGEIGVLEGDWRPSAIVIAEFTDAATARAWYGSPLYAQALAFRQEALTRNLILVEGVADADAPPPRAAALGEDRSGL
jgi:uncharacterized protein (DUF1330 family)